MGPHLPALLRRIEAEGQGLPPKIAEGLELEEPWMSFYLNAFTELSTCRRSPEMPIPWEAIDSYARRYNFTGLDYDQFLGLVRTMEAKRSGKSK